MKKNNKIILAVLFISPLAIYFLNFHGGFSVNTSSWSDFGSYVGGVYGTLGFFAVIHSIYKSDQQNLKMEQDQIFYKSMDLLSNRILNSSILINGSSLQGIAIFKEMVEEIKRELELQSMHNARNLLCNIPNEISDTHYIKILSAFYKNHVFDERVTEFKDELLKLDNYNSRWEYIKRYLGSVNYESKEMAQALQDLGTVFFINYPMTTE